MNDKNRNLVLRIVSAAVLLPLVIFLAAKGGFYCGILLSVAAAICTGEYLSIVSGAFRPVHGVAVLTAATFPFYAVWQPETFTVFIFWTITALFLFAWIFHLLRGPLSEAPTRAAHLITGTLYGGIGLSALSYVRNRPDGMTWIITAMVITWGNDTMAYFAGRLFGRHKLYPEVSPNKTWEGFFGGFLGSVGGMFIARLVYPTLTPLDCVVLGVGGGLLGPVGDLCESMLKRAYGVKDSGRVIPGHGGLLDRVDALIFNAPWVFFYVTLLRGAL